MSDQNVEVSNSRAQTRSTRFGGALGSFRIFKRGITANESAPAADIREGVIVGDRYEQCLWAVHAPAAVTAYTVHFLRWVSCVTDQGAEIIPGFWVEEFTVPVVVTGKPITQLQYVIGDALSAYVDGIAGVTTGGFTILRKGLVKRA